MRPPSGRPVQPEGFPTKEELQRRREGALTVQRVWHGHRVRRSLTMLRRIVIKMQRRWRSVGRRREARNGKEDGKGGWKLRLEGEEEEEARREGCPHWGRSAVFFSTPRLTRPRRRSGCRTSHAPAAALAAAPASADATTAKAVPPPALDVAAPKKASEVTSPKALLSAVFPHFLLVVLLALL